MALQLATSTRNARLEAIETDAGAAPILRIFSGAPPANAGSPNSGVVLATLNLPADWMGNAANGQKTMSGTWADNAADAAGTAGHFRLFKADGVTVIMQGTVTATGGGGDMEVDNTIFAQGQAFSVTQFTLTEPNA